MKKTIYLLLLGLVFSAKAQIKLGASFYGNATFSHAVAKQGYEEFAQNFDQFYQPKPSGSFQVFAAIPISKKWQFTAGLGYLNYGEMSKKLNGNFTFPSEIDEYYGFVKPDEQSENGSSKMRIFHITHAIEIPIGIRFALSKKFFVEGGISAVIPFASQNKTYDFAGFIPKVERKNSKSTDPLKPINMAASAGVGYTFCEAKNTEWFVALKGQYLLLAEGKKEHNINYKYYSAGIAVGLIF